MPGDAEIFEITHWAFAFVNRSGPNYRIQHFPTRIKRAPANPKAVLYSRFDRYWDKENDPESRSVGRGKKRGTLDLYERNSSGNSRARWSSSRSMTVG